MPPQGSVGGVNFSLKCPLCRAGGEEAEDRREVGRPRGGPRPGLEGDRRLDQDRADPGDAPLDPPRGLLPPLRPDRRPRVTRDCDRAIRPDCYAARLIIEKATSWRLALQNQAINTIAKSEISEIDESTAPVNGIARHQRVAKSSNGSAILHGRLKAAMTRTFPQRRRVLFAQMCRAPSKTSSRS